MQSRPALGPDSDLVRGAFALLQKIERRKQGLCLVEGLSNVQAALAAGVVKEILCTDEFASLDFGLTKVHIINSKSSAKISDTKTPPGMYAICKIPHLTPERLHRVLILDTLSDPGNLGTIIRSAHAFEFDAIYLFGHSADPWSGKVLRSCAGYAFTVPIIEIDAFSKLPDVKLLATSMNGSKSLQEVCSMGVLSKPHAWIVGNESHGISNELLDVVDMQVRIEMSDIAESLNAGVVASICAYHSYVSGASMNIEYQQ